MRVQQFPLTESIFLEAANNSSDPGFSLEAVLTILEMCMDDHY